jgi:hypothetical protein
MPHWMTSASRRHVLAFAAASSKPATSRAPLVSGAGLSLVTLVGYMVGSGRAYSYDASITVGRFVTSPSILDPFHRHDLFNNHVAFSFLDHLVYSLTGSSDERVLRFLPCLAAALAVGLIAYECSRRLGVLAGACAGVLLAISPMMLNDGREVRGYSLVVLSAVVATIAFFRLREFGMTRTLSIIYIVALAVGIATNIYTGMVLVVHAAIVVATGRQVRDWIWLWVLAVVGGVLPASRVLLYMYHDAVSRPRVFQADFPAQLIQVLLGDSNEGFAQQPLRGSVLIALAPVAVIGFVLLMRDRRAQAALGAVAGLVALVWVAAPLDLYPRLFIWLTPAVAVCGAVAVARWRGLVVLVAAALLAQIAFNAGRLGEDPLANRSIAAVFDRVHAAGGLPCALGHSAPPLVGYTRAYAEVDPRVDPGPDARARAQVPFDLPNYPSLVRLQDCDVVAVLGDFDPVETRYFQTTVRRLYPYTAVYPASYFDGYILSRRPLTEWNVPNK